MTPEPTTATEPLDPLAIDADLFDATVRVQRWRNFRRAAKERIESTREQLRSEGLADAAIELHTQDAVAIEEAAIVAGLTRAYASGMRAREALRRTGLDDAAILTLESTPSSALTFLGA